MQLWIKHFSVKGTIVHVHPIVGCGAAGQCSMPQHCTMYYRVRAIVKGIMYVYRALCKYEQQVCTFIESIYVGHSQWVSMLSS